MLLDRVLSAFGPHRGGAENARKPSLLPGVFLCAPGVFAVKQPMIFFWSGLREIRQGVLNSWKGMVNIKP
jgi:hypothetical protein